jgi:hypothetical protein
VTEGTGHVIDPAGDARRALQDAVTSHGPEVLSDATVMDHLCRTQLTALPGECILIVSAARSDVPALLRDAIPQYGNYGAIQSVATILAQASDLDGAASLWVVREFARALGLIAPGGTQSMPRPAPGGTGAGAPGSAVAAGAGAVGAAAAVGAGEMGAGGMGAGSGGGTGVPGGPELAPGMAGGPQPGMAGGPQPGMAGGPQPGMAAGPQPGMGGGPAGRESSGSKLLNRNTVGIAAAIALVAGYLGVAAVAHLSPFPAKTVAATSSQSPGTRPSTSPAATSPAATSPATSPDASPTSDYDVLLSKIPAAIQGRDNCHLAGTQFGATAVSQCSRLNLAAGTIIYYLYPSPAALASGVSRLLSDNHFHKNRECTTGKDFTDFLVECQTEFHNQTPFMTGSIAEYSSTSNAPIIVTSDNQQNVMAVLVGTNPGELLSYWKQLTWIKD